MTEPGGPLEVTTGPVLVVDDEPAVRGLFVRALRDAGYDTIEAADGIEALEILEHRPVALILLDSTMPRLDGAGVIRAVRGREATRTLPVILVTAKADLEDRVTGLDAGADDYMIKPVALDELVARVHAGLRSHVTMTQAVARQTEDRRRLAAALHRVREDGSPELRADSFVNDVMLALGIDHLALIGFTADEQAHLIVLKSSWPEQDRFGLPGSALNRSRTGSSGSARVTRSARRSAVPGHRSPWSSQRSGRGGPDRPFLLRDRRSFAGQVPARGVTPRA